MPSKKTPQKAGGKGELDRVGEKGTGGTGLPSHKENMTPPVQTPAPKTHDGAKVPK